MSSFRSDSNMISYRYGYGIVVANGCFRQYPTRLSFFDSVGDY